MLKRVVITNYRGEQIEYRIGDAMANTSNDPNWVSPETSGLLITSIDGLGPVKANINITELTTTDGGIFNSARLSSRNIVIKALFMNTQSIEEARLLSYKYFPIKKKLKFYIQTDNREAEIEGYVESNEPDIFSERCGCQISVLCESAFFNAAGDDAQQIIRFSSTVPMFKFPYRNVSTLAKPKETIFGEYIRRRESVITYNGDSETGIVLKIHFTGDATKVKIYNSDTSEYIMLDTDKLPSVIPNSEPMFLSGDDVEICTLQGKKSIKLVRMGETYNILNLLDKNSDWFMLAKGNNGFVYEATSGDENIELIIEAGVIYEGV